MGHTHAASDRNVYYLDQLCTIGFCGALGLVQILLYYCKSSSGIKVLDIILSQKFHIPVLISGIVLLSLAVVRGIALWVVSDNLRKGAALNAVQTFELVARNGWQAGARALVKG